MLVRQSLPLRVVQSMEGTIWNLLNILRNMINLLIHTYLEKANNYCSPLVQNEITGISVELVSNIILASSSIMADEARCYKEEQLAIVIRYAKQLEAEERLFSRIRCRSLKTVNL